MKQFPRGPLIALLCVVAWRVLLLVGTAQPIPANDAFGYDGGVVNYLHGGGYRNPSLALVFPISGREVYATYPPLYQGALLAWMEAFGASALSAMGLHLVLFAVSGFVTVWILGSIFPPMAGYSPAIGLLFGFTFDDRPESLAYVFGLLGLGLAARQISNAGFRWGTAVSLLACLLLCLFTSVIVGAYFFGAGFLACVWAGCRRRELRWFIPYVAAAASFALAIALIARLEPLWWAGFMESARQQSVMTTGFHRPRGADLLKLVRTIPVFLLALPLVPLLVARRRWAPAEAVPWLDLVAGVSVMSWGLIALSLTLLPANYFNFAVFAQVLLAAGILALAREAAPRLERWCRVMVWACVLLVSVRAMGMTTWGAVCAWRNSYGDTERALREELQPFVAADRPVLVSSPFLYGAVALGVKNPVHSDWFYDHAHWTNNVELNSLVRLQPSRLVLTQFDYYRDFAGLLDLLGRHPEWVEIRVRNRALVRSPDSVPSLRRVVQNISWAPVVVDLNWKEPPAR